MLALGFGIDLHDSPSFFLEAPPSAEEITTEELEKRREVSPSDALKSLPGMVVLGSEVTTYTGSLFLRGANSDQTLFVWNDFREDDFTAPAGAANPFAFGGEFSNQLRVLKGPQSLLYGTQALGGVVLIEQDPDADSSVDLAGGSLNTTRVQGEFRQAGGLGQWALGGSAFSTEGLSTYRAEIPQGPEGKLERDGRQKNSVSFLANWNVRAQDELQFLVNERRDHLRDDVPPLDDTDARSDQRETQWKLRYKSRWSGQAESSFLWIEQNSERENQNSADVYGPEDYWERSVGHRRMFLNRNEFQWLHSRWQLGGEWSEEGGDFSSRSDFFAQELRFRPESRAQSLYLVNDWAFGSADLSWGMRGSCQRERDCVGVYQVSYQHHWASVQRSVYGILSTGLKRPTLYQRYSSFGDSELHAERSQAYEVGLIQRWGAVQRLKLAVFDNRFSNLIDFDLAVLKFKNIQRAKTQGAELLHEFDGGHWDSQLSMAQVYAKDEESGSYLLRRPVLQGAWSLGYEPREALRMMTEWVFLGPREDALALNQRLQLGPVGLWNVAASYQSSGIEYFLRVNNLGNVFYEDIKNYQTPGRFVWMGAKIPL